MAEPEYPTAVVLSGGRRIHDTRQLEGSNVIETRCGLLGFPHESPEPFWPACARCTAKAARAKRRAADAEPMPSKTVAHDTIRAVLDAHPTLGGSGWHTRSTIRGWGWDEFPNRAVRDLEDLRSDHSITVIAAVAEWLSQWRTVKAAHAGSPHSYMLKHYAEKALTYHPDVRGYVSNGQLIAAAYALGYPVAHCYATSPDSEVGIRTTELKKMSQERVRNAP